jgi:hypothetical protein
MKKSSQVLLRREFERDLKPFGVTVPEIDALMEQCGYAPRKFIVVNVNRRNLQDAQQQRKR